MVQEKTVTIQTKEDNFNLFDMPWISNLRVMDNAEMARLNKRSGKESTVPAPPSFYDTDVSASNKKGTKFQNVDFKLIGNSTELSHLIQNKSKGSPSRSDINFGFGLRKYPSYSKMSPQKNNIWKFPGIKGSKETMSTPAHTLFSPKEPKLLSKGSMDLLLTNKKAYTRDIKFSDKFPQRNAGSIRHFFGKTADVGHIKWGSSLRWRSDREKNLEKRKKKVDSGKE
eukprot:CAMPEP_0205798910 /NCGR_PEP_ID=MMETSP0205-20121125/8_1 /ASSEMBLY_ACC=CAM_ASM_000278 /TAXON_ID=36767 /ORGANISM="Euplotes focardii, Strain TN1" /LENGTH=225 /DNA_ID=CAMNT_0053059349 /DNA_START=211 /DNA_END=888 /DNA_ORIENTATION=-